MTYVLRPEDITWPGREGEGDSPEQKVPLFSLEHLNLSTQILTNKQARNTLLHISGMFPATQGCISPIVPLIVHPTNKNEIICYDLRHNPSAMLEMSVDEIIENLYKPRAESDESHQHIALKGIHINKSPALSPTKTLTDELTERWEIDWKKIEAHKQQLIADNTLIDRLKDMYNRKREMSEMDADSALYGGFISNEDRKLCKQVLSTSPEALSSWTPKFNSERLKKLYPRYTARNWPETLSPEEQQKWRQFCQARLIDGEYGCSLTTVQFQQRLEELSLEDLTERDHKALGELVTWVQG